jgi:hypothetical protein
VRGSGRDVGFLSYRADVDSCRLWVIFDRADAGEIKAFAAVDIAVEHFAETERYTKTYAPRRANRARFGRFELNPCSARPHRPRFHQRCFWPRERLSAIRQHEFQRRAVPIKRRRRPKIADNRNTD